TGSGAPSGTREPGEDEAAEAPASPAPRPVAPPKVTEAAALGTLGEVLLRTLMGGLSLVLGPHWAVSDEEAKAWGKALEDWAKAQPPKRRRALSKALGAVPTVNLIGTTALILAPRVQMTLQMRAIRKETGDERKGGTGSGVPGNLGADSPGSPEKPYGYDFAGAVRRLSEQDAGGAGSGDSGGNGEVRGAPKARA
ncbi:MAG: hypothetical protein P3W93_006390, partial [Thermus sp.]|nr:hypothetical protein [Thermus sp.]